MNDSLIKLEKYQFNFRKVYTVRVTMKSKVSKEIRVMMDKDGIIPWYTESEFADNLKQYVDIMGDAINTLY